MTAALPALEEVRCDRRIHRRRAHRALDRGTALTTDPSSPASASAAQVRAKLDDRYGRRSGTGPGDRRRRMGTTAAGVLAIGIALGYVVWVAFHAATPAVSAVLLGYDVRDAASVEVRIEVRRDPAHDVRCLLRAQDVDNITVGRLALDVPRGGNRTAALAAVIPTTRLAINGELEECSAAEGE